MRDVACDAGAFDAGAFNTGPFDAETIAADAMALAELPGGSGREQIRIDWLHRRLAGAPGRRHVDEAGNLVWTFGPPPYRLAVLVHVDDVFGEATVRGVTRRDGWLCGPGIGDNAIAVATAVAVAERALAGPGDKPLVIVFTVGEEGLGASGARPIRPRSTGRKPRWPGWPRTPPPACGWKPWRPARPRPRPAPSTRPSGPPGR